MTVTRSVVYTQYMAAVRTTSDHSAQRAETGPTLLKATIAGRSEAEPTAMRSLHRNEKDEDGRLILDQTASYQGSPPRYESILMMRRGAIAL